MVIFLLFFLLLHAPAFALTITASFFNQTYSAQNPLVLTENTTIQMDESIIIATKEPLFKVQNDAIPIQLTFSQTGTKTFQVFVEKDAVFNLKNFTKNSQIIFQNCNLNMQNKSTILLVGNLVFENGGTIVLSD